MEDIHEFVEDIHEFVETVTKEESRFRWTIKNFSRIFGQEPLPRTVAVHSHEGSAGHPSKWKLELGYSGHHNDSSLELRLSVLELAEGVKPEDMQCDVRIKARVNPQDKDFLSTILTTGGSKKLADTIQMFQEGALVIDDELVINLKFVLSVAKMDHSTASALTSATTARNISEQSRVELSNNFGSLLQSGLNADFLICVKQSDGKLVKIKVHKAILGARSPVFQRMLGSQMTEAASGSMLIVDLSLECVSLMIKWIYTGTLYEEWKMVPEEIVVAADKYDLPNLRSFLDAHLHHACTLENAMSLRKVARLHGLATATKNVNKFIRTNLEEIPD